MNNTTSVKERLIAYLEYKGINKSEFGRIIGVSNAFITSMRKSIQPDKVKAIKENFTDLNIDWLLYDEGEMLKESLRNEVESITQQEREAIEEGVRDGSFRLVPLKNIDSVGGIHSENAFSSSEQYTIKMVPFTEAREGDVAILQSGNSMYPTIPSGSALLIREVVDWREYFGYGGIYVLWLRDGRRITKEVRRYDSDPKNYVWCVSYNPDIADEELPKSMIRGVWKVVKYIADFGW